MRVKSNDALNVSVAQAAGADIDPFRGAVDDSADTLDVGFPGTLGGYLGMADVVAMCGLFATDFAFVCHKIHLLQRTGYPQSYFNKAWIFYQTGESFASANFKNPGK